MASADRTDVWVGSRDARFQFLDEGNVSGVAVLNCAKADAARCTEPDPAARTGKQYTTPVGRRRAEITDLENLHQLDVAIRNAAGAAIVTPFKSVGCEPVTPLGGQRMRSIRVRELGHDLLCFVGYHCN